jgi:transcriptional regulator with XRE-family HTH domain
MNTLGELIKEMREKHNLPQRVVAYKLDMDVSVLSRIENENKFPKKRISEIIHSLSELFGVPEKDLLKVYKSDIIASILLDEVDVDSILKESTTKIEYLKSKNTIQTEMEF